VIIAVVAALALVWVAIDSRWFPWQRPKRVMTMYGLADSPGAKVSDRCESARDFRDVEVKSSKRRAKS